MSELSVFLLGPFAATLNGEPLTQFRTRSVQALLVYLVCEAERPHQREALMELLWPGMPLASAQANLRQTLYRLRRLIPELLSKNGRDTVPFLLTNRQTVQINPEGAYSADVHAFDAGIDSDPAQAVSLYRGDFLADFYLPDSETFEEWAAARRAAYRRQALNGMELVTASHLREANFDEAEALARQQIAIDNLRESSHRQLLEALARNGRRQDALAHYNDLQRLLQDEMAVEPEGETIDLIAAIRNGELASNVPTIPRRSVWFDGEKESADHNLPELLTSFVGREKELAAVSDLINNNRLIMLTGPGGIGKTILCLQVGRRLLATFPDGVWLVELAPVSDPALVTQTAANALNLRESADLGIKEILLDYLREKECLLILDNCEHLIDSAAQFAVLMLQACPGLKILASSREALGVPGEVPYRVPPLSLPDREQKVRYEDWSQYDALRLFIDRAVTVMPGFQVTQENLPALVSICRRLDGMPLALELAAARVNVLTVAQISARLDDRFRLLTGGSRTALPRQQTLRALIDWSWDLLADSEKTLLSRLSVFAGGMDLEAVEAVCTGDGIDQYELLDILSGLVNKSLVISQRQQGQETRYTLLETIRQYAQERLLGMSQGEKYRSRHLEYFQQLALTSEPELVRSDQLTWHHRLNREADNFRTALNWALETNIEAGLRLISATWRNWGYGRSREGEAWLSKLFAHAEIVSPDVKAKALIVRSRCYSSLANLELAHKYAEESLTLYHELGDQHGIGRSLGQLGSMTMWRGGHGKGRSMLLESLRILREVGDKLGTADVLSGLGFHEWKFNYEQGMAYLAESEALYREMGHLIGVIIVQDTYAQLAIWQGDLKAARRILEEDIVSREPFGLKENAYFLHLQGDLHFRLQDYEKALHFFERSYKYSYESGEIFTNYWVVVRIGYVYLRMGAYKKARTYLEKSIRLFNSMDSVDGVIYAIEGLASMALQQEQPELAARLFGWSDATRTANQDPRPPVEQADVGLDLAVIIDTIGQEAYIVAYAAGKKLTTEQAIDCALGIEIAEEGLLNGKESTN